jgi:hypothetical protein
MSVTVLKCRMYYDMTKLEGITLRFVTYDYDMNIFGQRRTLPTHSNLSSEYNKVVHSMHFM